MPSEPVVRTLAEARERMKRTLVVDYELDGEWVRLQLRRLLGGEEDLVRKQLAKALPPLKQDENGKQFYDTTDPGYKRESEDSFYKARSLAAYLSLPELWVDTATGERCAQPPLTNVDEIHRKIMLDPVFNNSVLHLIWVASQAGGVEERVRELANFTSGSGSPKS